MDKQVATFCCTTATGSGSRGQVRCAAPLTRPNLDPVRSLPPLPLSPDLQRRLKDPSDPNSGFFGCMINNTLFQLPDPAPMTLDIGRVVQWNISDVSYMCSKGGCVLAVGSGQIGTPRP